MSKLPLTIATWDYDRTRALIDGRVVVEGCDVNYIVLPVEECFERAYFHKEFDVAEIGFSPYLIALSRGISPYTALPAFLSRTFRHSCIYIRSDRSIEEPSDLRAKRMGVPEYQMSAALWARGFMQDDYSVRPDEIEWVQGGLETPGRREKFPLNLPQGFPLTREKNSSLSELLSKGKIDGIISARSPPCFSKEGSNIRRLFPDFRTSEQDYFRRTRIFPIMHAVGIRNDLLDRHPWLAASIYKAFYGAKLLSDRDLEEVTALKIGLPWLAAELAATRDVMGADFWPYGIDDNRHTLETMARYSYEQGLATQMLTVEQMFPPSTFSETRV